MLRTALLSAVILGAACGTPSKSPSAPGGPDVEFAPFPTGSPLITPGERMTYRLELRGLALAQMTIGAGDVAELAGRKAILVQGNAKSVGLANLVAAINDTFTSWIDVETGRSLRFQVDEYETNSKTNVEHTVLDLAARANDLVPITFSLNEATPEPEPQRVSFPEVWDWNAFLIALRSWEGKPGSSAQLQVFRSRYMWHIDVKIAGKQQLTTDLGELPSLRFDAHTYKYARDLTRYPDTDERDFSVWISDDDGRVPLQLTARTDYGDIKMMIVDYQPGTGTRLRP